MEKVGDIINRLRTEGIPLRKNTEMSPIDESRSLEAELRLPLLHHTFANFKRRKGTEIAYKAFKDLADGVTELPFLLCTGGVGNGKTHLVEALIRRWYERGILCRYLRCADVLSVIKRGMEKDQSVPVEERVRIYSEGSRLVIDDIGGGVYETDWVRAQLENIIDARYRNRLVTVATTNLDLSELPERIGSRFADPSISQLVINEATDYRRRQL